MALNFRRPIELYRYLPFKTATALTICEATRALLDPYGRPSYAENGEDRIIEFYIEDKNRAGFYVDIGCHHPFRKSNTFSLYLRGWRGVVVDGNPELIALFKRFRPRDAAICGVVSDQERPVTFTLAEDPDLSTVSSAFEQRIGDSGVKQRVTVRSVTLQTILERSDVPSNFELLSIDAEGHDYEVLTSFNIKAFRPRIIVIEMHGFMPAEHSTNRIREYLEQENYQLRSYSVMNGIFLDAAAVAENRRLRVMAALGRHVSGPADPAT
jgi:FkbM family methyltransferase